MIQFAAWTGIRAGELYAMRWPETGPGAQASLIPCGVRTTSGRRSRVTIASHIRGRSRSSRRLEWSRCAAPSRVRSRVAPRSRPAKAVVGVEAVYDELDMRPLPHDPRDDEIRGAALQLLIRDTRVPETAVDVAVADRWVTLKGEVRHQSESDAAYEDVAQLEGIGGITNVIKVVTAPRLS